MNFIKARIEKMSNTELIGEFGFFEAYNDELLDIHGAKAYLEKEKMFIDEMAKRFDLDVAILLKLINQ